MCGIAGIFAASTQPIALEQRVHTMSETLGHRGPDSRGDWIDTGVGVAVAHRRLSIVDLSEYGTQPIESHDNRSVLVFNGEIYNHLQLREELYNAGAVISWRGHSDSETLVECLSFWGVEKTLKAAVGMFAFALWDRKNHELTLARDRLGEKPLYYARGPGMFAFGSELKSLQCLPELPVTLNTAAIVKFLQVGYIPDPETAYREVRKVPAGTWVSIKRENITADPWPPPRMFWSLEGVAKSGLAAPLSSNHPEETVKSLERLLSSTISSQLMGDVPVGAFLSGGVDSTAVVALMQKISSQPIKTFSIGFESKGYDETPYAAAIAKVLGTDHHQLRVGDSDVAKTVPDLSATYDEPFADSSQIPTLMVAKLAREHVRVSLSGDGGDELFAGYNRYILAGQQWARLEKIPLSLREVLANRLARIPASRWDKVLVPAMRAVPKRLRVSLPGDKIHKVARILGSTDSLELYSRMVSQLSLNALKSDLGRQTEAARSRWPIRSDLVHQMMFLDSLTYLPGDILTKVDRATMAHSLESRMPFLNHHVVEFAWQVPLSLKIRNGQSKWLLREMLRQYVPDSYFDRPKMGFGGPLGEWLRGPLRGWASDLLSPARLEASEYLEASVVAQMWKEHLSGTHNWEHGLWNVLMLESWLDSEQARSMNCPS